MEPNKYLYQGKEFENELGLETYDFEWRMYDPAIGRTFQLDPHSDNYFGLSPYSWVANNPLKYIDPDGRDYGLHFDHENKTVTVKATYYTTSGSTEAARSSADFWNGQSGSFTYSVGKGDDAVSYSVNFDVSVSEIEVDSNLGEMGSLNQALSNDQSGEGNIFMVVDDSKLSDNQNGKTIGGNFIQIRESRASSETGAHEIGHSLGLTHQSKGLMTPGSTDRGRNASLIKGDVKDIIKYPLKGKVNSENGNYAGRGTVRDSTPIINRTTTITPKKLHKGKIK